MNRKYFILFLFFFSSFSFSQSDTAYKFIVYGDSRSGHEAHKKIVELITERNYEFILNTGDIVDSGKYQVQWDKMFEIISPLFSNKTPKPTYLAAIGNHDIAGDKLKYEKWHKNMNWLPGNREFYVYDYKNVRLIVLNSCSEKLDEQTDSLKQWLSSNKKEWLLVAWHHPSFTFSDAKIESKTFNSWWPLIYKYSVDIIFNGHKHHYVRTYPVKPLLTNPFGVRDNENGVIEIITGGGGAPLYKVEKNKENESYFNELLAKYDDTNHHFCEVTVDGSILTVKVINLNNQVIDQFTLQK